MLKNVTNKVGIEQFSGLTCFIIHVGLCGVGEKAYAWRTTKQCQTTNRLFEFC